MNPETKLTSDQIRAICSTHGISYHSHERISTGFSHEVHRLNDDMVIKLFNLSDEKHQQNFKTELAVLGSALPIKKPRLIAHSDSTQSIDRSYVIMTCIPGISLGNIWHRATDSQREVLIAEICKSLRLINEIEPNELGLKQVDSWFESVRHRSEALVVALKNKTILDEETAERVFEVVKSNLALFKDSRLYPVYWDIHFDNFIVNTDFELQAIIDLENVELASLDYPLFVVQKQSEEPEKYLSEEFEKYASTADYTNLKTWYRHYYPEMFDFDHLEDRVRIYQILDILHLLKEGWSHVKELHIKLDKLTR